MLARDAPPFEPRRQTAREDPEGRRRINCRRKDISLTVPDLAREETERGERGSPEALLDDRAVLDPAGGYGGCR